MVNSLLANSVLPNTGLGLHARVASSNVSKDSSLLQSGQGNRLSAFDATMPMLPMVQLFKMVLDILKLLLERNASANSSTAASTSTTTNTSTDNNASSTTSASTSSSTSSTASTASGSEAMYDYDPDAAGYRRTHRSSYGLGNQVVSSPAPATLPTPTSTINNNTPTLSVPSTNSTTPKTQSNEELAKILGRG